ncbi:MAG: UDP-galactopyranose mutase, partial [Clostridiales bacterium]|nr:UDP-galactopyranose mutase [Candidatus Coliplasma caballi]
SLVIAFGYRKAEQIRAKLIETYGEGNSVSILQLRESKEPLLHELADFVYHNVFETYTVKQWGMRPEEIDPAVTARVPVRISKDNSYFTDRYQGIPRDGYTPLFERMLDHQNIELCLNTPASSRLRFEDGKIFFDGAEFSGKVLYTGALDELFGNEFGRLPYRSLDFRFETLPKEYAQLCGTVNYTVSEDYTRITEFKHLTGQKAPVTTIMKEFSKPCGADDTPYYPVRNPESEELYGRYRKEAERYPSLYLCGRLAEFRYYNMDAAAASALSLGKTFLKTKQAD